MGTILYYAMKCLLWGAIMGLIPYVLGRYLGKPEWGQIGLLICTICGVFHTALPPLAAIALCFAIFLSHSDLSIRSGPASGTGASGRVGGGEVSGNASSYTLRCVAGPIQGQAYRIGANGLTIGRGSDCTVRLPDTAGISRHHCCIRWQGSELALVDLGSSYGTFLASGRRLTPDSPVPMTKGTQFYLGSRRIMFRITT